VLSEKLPFLFLPDRSGRASLGALLRKFFAAADRRLGHFVFFSTCENGALCVCVPVILVPFMCLVGSKTKRNGKKKTSSSTTGNQTAREDLQQRRALEAVPPVFNLAQLPSSPTERARSPTSRKTRQEKQKENRKSSRLYCKKGVTLGTSGKKKYQTDPSLKYL
jgi:hypothetical protein